MMDPILSIIIPYYNTSWDMLKMCIDSIKNQESNDYEVLLINDKSSNEEGINRCREYVIEDKKFKFFDNDINRGVSYTRNKGIELARGKYIMFVDSDDWIENGTLNNLIQKAQENYDTIFYEYQRCDGENRFPLYRNIEPGECKQLSQTMVKRMILSIDFNSPCTILYSKDIIQKNNITFDENIKMGEDFLFNAKYLQKYENGYYIKEIFYNYRYNMNSATNSFKIDYVKDCGEGYECRKLLIDKYMKQSSEYVEIDRELTRVHIKSAFTYVINGFSCGATKEIINQCIDMKWIQEVLHRNDINGIKYNIYKYMLKHKMFLLLRFCGVLKKYLKK